jgi:hypothetical protein
MDEAPAIEESEWSMFKEGVMVGAVEETDLGPVIWRKWNMTDRTGRIWPKTSETM